MMKLVNLLVVLCMLLGHGTGYELVVYAVDTLFDFPYYNFTQAFEVFAGLPEGSVLLVSVDDGELEKTILQPNLSPIPDVVIGVDNINQFQLPQNTFLPVTPSAASGIDPHLLAQSSSFNLFPYEYGRITLIGNNTRIGNVFDPLTVTLHSLISSPEILKGLLVQDPIQSVTGAAFVLATIATFGDSKAGVVGEVTGEGDWKDWWAEVLKYATVVPTWDDSWALFQNESYYLMISYELDPVYYYCTANETDIIALDLAGDQWYLVEALGVYNRSTNPTLALQFVNWFLSEQVQSLVPDHEWMFPAQSNITLPACFNGKYVTPNPSFNEILNTTTLLQNLASWDNQWEVTKNLSESETATSSSGASLGIASLLAPLLFLGVSLW